MKAWSWITGGAALFALGSVLWFTAWIAWSIGVVLSGVGFFAWAKQRRRAKTPVDRERA